MPDHIVDLDGYVAAYNVHNKNDEDIPVYSVTQENGFCVNYFSKDVSGEDKTTYKIVPRGYFAYNPLRINVGSIDWQNVEDRVLISSRYVVFKLLSDEIDPRYLVNLLKSEPYLRIIKERCRGTVRPELTIHLLKKIPILLRPVTEQNEIVKQFDNIRQKRNQIDGLIKGLDELIKSRFVEIFDPIHCDKWIPLSRVVTSIESGKSFNCEKKRSSDDKPAILKLGAIFGGIYNPKENKEIEPDLFIQTLEVKKGDVLMSRKNTYDLVGTAAYVTETPPNLMIPDLIFRINLDKSIDPIFFVYLINNESFRPKIKELAHGSSSSMPNISKEALRGLTIPVVSLENQKKFASFVKQLDKSKCILQKQLNNFDELLKTMEQTYFSLNTD